MNQTFIVPLFDDLLKSSKLQGYIVYTEEEKKYYRVNYGYESPFYRWEQKTEIEFLKLINKENVFTYYAKNLFKIFNASLLTKVTDLNTLIYNMGFDPYTEEPDGYSTKPPVRYNKLFEYIKDIEFDQNKIIYHPNYRYLLQASAILDDYFIYEDKRKIKFYDHYTKGHRLRDTLGNTLSMPVEKRQTIPFNGFKVLMDIDSFHLRILNKLIDGDLPSNVRGHDWIIQQAFGNIDADHGKKMIFRALYSENFTSVPCKFMEKLSKVYRRIQSPFGRPHNNFNYKIQEYESLIISKLIIKLSEVGLKPILYLYDGILFGINREKLSMSLAYLKEKIEYPFTVEVAGKKLKINYI